MIPLLQTLTHNQIFGLGSSASYAPAHLYNEDLSLLVMNSILLIRTSTSAPFIQLPNKLPYPPVLCSLPSFAPYLNTEIVPKPGLALA